jgi:AraC-like DNA-binding protein
VTPAHHGTPDDGVGGAVRYREFAPQPALAPWIRLIWTLELDDWRAFGPPERILPDGIVELVFHWGEPFTTAFAGRAAELQPRSFAIAQARSFVEIAPRGRSGFVSVRFEPGGVCHFMRPPVSSFTDSLAAAGDLWGRAVDDLESALGEAGSPAARVGLLERFLLAQLERHHKPGVSELVAALFACPGDARIATLCRELGVGERRLERTLQAAVGTSPKQALRVARFRRAGTRLRKDRGRDLAELALACGYYDQAHFNGDFKALSGLTPLEFAADPGIALLPLD